MANLYTLYHGTVMGGLTKIIPREHSIVYLTPNQAYALFYILDKDINWVTCGVKENGIVQYEEQFPNQLQTIYEGSCGSLYTVDPTDTMESIGNGAIWTSKQPVSVYTETHIADVYATLLSHEQAGAISVTRYEHVSADRKRDIHEMMVHYIHKHNLITQTTKKSRFVQETFPAAWTAAASLPERRQAVLEEWEKKHDKQLQARH